MENGNNPAHPISGSLIDKCGQRDFSPFGLTKREYFAAMAMQGMISNAELCLSKEEADVIASQSIQFADSLLQKLETTK